MQDRPGHGPQTETLPYPTLPYPTADANEYAMSHVTNTEYFSMCVCVCVCADDDDHMLLNRNTIAIFK